MEINPLFALVAELTGTSEKEETRPFETILKKSGLVIPGIGNSNQIITDLTETFTSMRK